MVYNNHEKARVRNFNQRQDRCPAALWWRQGNPGKEIETAKSYWASHRENFMREMTHYEKDLSEWLKMTIQSGKRVAAA